jgi:hypothetical protein
LKRLSSDLERDAANAALDDLNEQQLSAFFRMLAG